jgi:hypothetical protein
MTTIIEISKIGDWMAQKTVPRSCKVKSRTALKVVQCRAALSHVVEG